MLHINKFRTLVITLIVSLLSISTIISSDNNDSKSNQKDIVSIAVESGSFNTLAAALKAANLVETLQSDGPFTVFAPTDEAFAKLPEGTVEALLKDKEALKEILLYHVVSGKVTSSEVSKLESAKTIQGEDVRIKIADKNVYINDSKVTSPDIMASNGVIHVIDTVLLHENK